MRCPLARSLFFSHTHLSVHFLIDAMPSRSISLLPPALTYSGPPSLLRGVPLGPESRYPVVLLAVLCVLSGDAADERVGRVAVCEEGADGEKDLGDGERGAPVVLEDVEADDAVAVDVAVVDARAEGHLGRLEGVLWREVQVKEEDAALVHRTGRAQDRRHPLVDVVALWTGAAVGRRVDGDLGELLLDPLGRRAQGLRRHLLHGLRILLGVPPGPLPLLPRGPAGRGGRPRRGRRRRRRRRARSRHHSARSIHKILGI